MRKQGTIRRWEVERGFGFIDSGDSRDVFVHIKDFAKPGTTPVAGMQVTYEEIQVGGKGPRAVDVRLAGRAATAANPPQAQASERPRSTQSAPARRASAPATGSSLFKVLLLIWVALYAFAVFSGRMQFVLLAIVGLINLVTYLTYSFDKDAAEKSRWRVSENTLHMLSLIGGWPMAWYAQQSLRHKSSKHEFRVMYWVTVFGNCALVAVYVLFPQLWRSVSSHMG